MRTLVTGAAGFIGFHLCRLLLERGDEVLGLDSINDYYDPELKYGRLELLGIGREEAEREAVLRRVSALRTARGGRGAFSFRRAALEDRAVMESLASEGPFDRVCNLAAQAGVRYSLENPRAYVEANVVGFLNVLELCRATGVGHLVFASSSSVYGLDEALPFSVHAGADHPVSLYAATKKADEMMAHAYAHLYGLPATGLRFFTVYGPWGRPDMAYFKFAKAIVEGRPIELYNGGDMLRDFTYIDDVVEGVARVLDRPARPDPSWNPSSPDPASSSAPYRLYNLGNSAPERLESLIAAIEKALGRKAERRLLPMQSGDVRATAAEVSDLECDFGWKPSTPLEEGIGRFAAWFQERYLAK
jgi:UDP-glucuronate 4-epimerase